MSPKEAAFTVIQEQYRAGSTVRILPGYNGHERKHEGRYGFICKAIPMHNYAEHTTSYLYSVRIDSAEWPYSHHEVEAMS